MPRLDVAFMTKDPMLADCFDVLRREDVVGVNGRTTPTVVKTFQRVRGVVTQQDPADLTRRDDGQMVPRLIQVCTTFAVRGVVTGLQPDLISWNGTQYLVKQVYPYSRFGHGTYEVVAESMMAVDVPQ